MRVDRKLETKHSIRNGTDKTIARQTPEQLMYATRSVATRLSIFKLMQGSPRAVPSATMYKQLSHVWRKSDATSIWDIPPRCGPSQRVEGRLCWYISCDYPKARRLPVKAEYLVVVEVVSSHADASVRCWSHLAVCPVF